MLAATDRPSQRDAKREQTRARVFRAALGIFRRDGVEQARIEDIARRAKVSRALFYFHFPTRQDVLAELVAASEARVAADVSTLPSLALPALLDEVAARIAREWEDDHRLLAASASVALAHDPDAHPLRAVLARRLACAAADGELSGLVEPATLADLFLLNQFAAAIGWAHQPRGTLDAVLRVVASLFLDGARARP